MGRRPTREGSMRALRHELEPWECVQPSLGALSCSGPALRGILGLCPPPHIFTQGPLRPGHSLQPVSLGGERGVPRPHRSGRPGCPRRRRWMLPSTSGGRDPISVARECYRCFLPGQTQNCKGWERGHTGKNGSPRIGGAPHTQQQEQLPALLRKVQNQ